MGSFIVAPKSNTPDWDMVEYCLDVLVSVFHFDISVQLNCTVKVRRVYTSLLYSSRMFVCGLSPPERLDRLGCTVYRYLRLGPGKVLGKKISRSIHGFAGNPGKTGFYSSIYITLYYRNNGLTYWAEILCEASCWSGEGLRLT